MRKMYFFLILGIFFLSQESNSLDLDRGEKLFEKHCSICHKNGENIIIPEKNLKKETLELNGLNSIDSISYQITNGKNGMPAFGGRLKEKEILEISNYILFKSEKNFKI